MQVMLNNFTAGELSPRMLARHDVEKYKNGCKELRNCFIQVQGGIFGRPGLRYVAEVKDSSKATRLVPFEFSTTQAYMLEFGNLYCRYYKDGGRIESTKSITNAVDNGSGLVRITSNNHGFNDSSIVTITGVGGVPGANGTFMIQGGTANTFDLAASSFSGTYTSGGTAVNIVENIMPYAEAHLFDLKFAQSADVLYIVHPAFAPRKLTRTSHTAWTVSTVDFIDGPYLKPNRITPDGAFSGISITNSGTSGSITLTATGNLFTVGTDVGRLIRMKEGSAWKWLKITAVASATSATATVMGSAFAGSGVGLSNWRLGAWSATTGYPGAICFYEQRLMFAGSTAQPLGVWGSVSGIFEDMTPDDTNGAALDDAAVDYTVASSYVNPFHWMVEDRGIFAGNSKSEIRITGGGNDSPMTPSNARAVVQTVRGSKSIQPVKAGDYSLFVQRAGKKVRALQYNFNSDSYQAKDLTVLAEHITDPGVVDWTYQQEPDSIVLAVLSDGELAAMTYVADQDAIGWSRHYTNGLFESVATIPTDTTDQTWAIVNRTVDGSGVRYVEYFDPELHMDSALEYDDTPVTAVSGLDHLEGMTVAIVGDGAEYNNQVVTGGSVSLEPATPASNIVVGLPYYPYVTLLRPELQVQDGSMQGRAKRYVNIGVRVLDTRGVTVNGQEAEVRSPDDNMDEAPPGTTGDISLTNLGWDEDAEITISQPKPLPFNVLGVYGLLEVGEA